MKLKLNLLIAIIGGVYLLVACEPKNGLREANTPPPVLGAPVAQGTATQGGGGDLPPQKEVSIEELKALIKDLKLTIEPVLYRMEAYGVTYSQALKVFNDAKNPKPEESAKNLVTALDKMFKAENAPVYAELERIKFVAHSEGACHDLKNEDKDGSAFNKNPNEICLSVPRLQKKVDHQSELSEVLSLAIHELSHRVKATEEEAQAIQFMVLKQFGSATPESFTEVFSNGIDNSPNIWRFTGEEKTFQEKDSSLLPALCARIGENAVEINKIINKKSNDANAIGVMFERPNLLRALKAASLQSQFLMGFCDNFYQDSFAQMLIDKGFDPEKPFPVSFLNDGEPNPLQLTPQDGQLVFVKPSDWKAALFTYREVKKNMDKYISRGSTESHH